MKIAGRDAGKRCVILSEIKDNRVLIDGETRRRWCNVKHLEPLPTVLTLEPEATHAAVSKALAPLNVTSRQTKPKKAAPRPHTLRRSKLAAPAEPAKTEKPAKKTRTKKTTDTSETKPATPAP